MNKFILWHAWYRLPILFLSVAQDRFLSSVQCRPNLADVSMVNEREIDSCPSDNKEHLTILSSVSIKKIISMENTNELSTQVRGCIIWWEHNGTNKDYVMCLPYVCNFVSLISLVHMQRSWIISYLLLMECRLIESLIIFSYKKIPSESLYCSPCICPMKKLCPREVRWLDLPQVISESQGVEPGLLRCPEQRSF